jgi:hypothetical protein
MCYMLTYHGISRKLILAPSGIWSPDCPNFREVIRVHLITHIQKLYVCLLRTIDLSGFRAFQIELRCHFRSMVGSLFLGPCGKNLPGHLIFSQANTLIH